LTNITELLGCEFDTSSGEFLLKQVFFYACKWSLQLYYFICCIFQWCLYHHSVTVFLSSYTHLPLFCFFQVIFGYFICAGLICLCTEDCN